MMVGTAPHLIICTCEKTVVARGRSGEFARGMLRRPTSFAGLILICSRRRSAMVCLLRSPVPRKRPCFGRWLKFRPMLGAYLRQHP